MCKSPDPKISRMTIDHGLKSKNNILVSATFYIYKQIYMPKFSLAEGAGQSKFNSELLVKILKTDQRISWPTTQHFQWTVLCVDGEDYELWYFSEYAYNKMSRSDH